MLTAIAIAAGGAATTLIGVYYWNHPDRYYKYLHRTSPLAAAGVRPPLGLVRFGAALAAVAGLGVVVWGFGRLVA